MQNSRLVFSILVKRGVTGFTRAKRGRLEKKNLFVGSRISSLSQSGSPFSPSLHPSCLTAGVLEYDKIRTVFFSLSLGEDEDSDK